MNCPYCGSDNPEGSTTCAACGQSLVAAPSAAPAAPTAPEGYSQPPAYAAPPQPPAQPTYAPPPAPPAPPAGYGQPTYAQPQVVAAVPVKNHLVLAIVSIFFCWPLAIVAIVNASQVNSKLAMGDVAGAQAASKNAALWAWIGIGVSLVISILYFIFFLVLGLSQSGMTSY